MDAQRIEALDEIIQEADSVGGPTPEQQAEQAQAAGLEEGARAWGAVMYMVGGALSMVAPELRQVYTEQACLNWGRAAAPVAEKYGWNNPAALPELGLVIATAGFVVPSAVAIRARVVAMREEKNRSGWLGHVAAWWALRRAKREGMKAAEAARNGE